MLGGVPYLIGYLMLSYAHYLPTAVGFKCLLFIGRFVTGVGMGWAGSSGPVSIHSCNTMFCEVILTHTIKYKILSPQVYIGELSSAKLRGIFGSFIPIALAMGVLLTYALSTISDFPYYYNSLVAAGIAAVFESMMVWLYETPRWLILNGQSQKAHHTLRWLRGPSSEIESEIYKIESAETASMWLACREISRLRRHVTVPIVVVMLAMFFHQIGGGTVVASYAAVLFEEAGVANPRVTAAYAVGGVEVFAVIFSVFVIDLVGRKLLLILSGIGMVIGSTLLGLHFYLTRPSLCSSSSNGTLSEMLQDDAVFENCLNSQYAPLAITSIIIFIVAYSIGWAPVPWVLLSELIPNKVRGVASGMATIVNWVSLALVVGVYLEYGELVQEWFVWWSFSVLNSVAVVFVLIFVRETKGKTLEDIEEYYREHKC